MPDQSAAYFEALLSYRFLIWNMCFIGLRNLENVLFLSSAFSEGGEFVQIITFSKFQAVMLWKAATATALQTA